MLNMCFGLEMEPVKKLYTEYMLWTRDGASEEELLLSILEALGSILSRTKT